MSRPATYDDLAAAITRGIRGQKFSDSDACQACIKGIIETFASSMQEATKSGGGLLEPWKEVKYGCGCKSHTTWQDGCLGDYGHETKHDIVCSLSAMCGVYKNLPYRSY